MKLTYAELSPLSREVWAWSWGRNLEAWSESRGHEGMLLMSLKAIPDRTHPYWHHGTPWKDVNNGAFWLLYYKILEYTCLSALCLHKMAHYRRKGRQCCKTGPDSAQRKSIKIFPNVFCFLNQGHRFRFQIVLINLFYETVASWRTTSTAVTISYSS